MLFSNVKCDLGEGPLWHPSRNSLFWLDILNQKLYEKIFNSDAKDFDHTWDLPEIGSALALDETNVNSLFILTDQSFSKINLNTGKLTPFINLPLPPNMRSNDGGIAPNGDFWFGCMEKKPTGKRGHIYSISPKGKLTHQLDCIGIPNTFLWSADGLFYLSDSLCQKTFVFEPDGAQRISHSRKTIFIDLTTTSATPDGGAIDTEENIWNAQWNGFKVQCYSSSRALLHSINFPVPQLSSCCFGGPKNSFLFVTSAREGMSPTELEKYPLSGCVFTIKMHEIFGAKVSGFDIKEG